MSIADIASRIQISVSVYSENESWWTFTFKAAGRTDANSVLTGFLVKLVNIYQEDDGKVLNE
jgi:hypothetical protein